MPQIVESDLADVGEFADHVVVAVHVRWVQRPAGGSGEHQADIPPRLAGLAAVDLLAPVVPPQRRHALLRDRDAPCGAVGLHVLECGAAGGAGQGASDGEVPGGEVQVVPAQAEQLALAQPGAQRRRRTPPSPRRRRCRVGGTGRHRRHRCPGRSEPALRIVVAVRGDEQPWWGGPQPDWPCSHPPKARQATLSPADMGTSHQVAGGQAQRLIPGHPNSRSGIHPTEAMTQPNRPASHTTPATVTALPGNRPRRTSPPRPTALPSTASNVPLRRTRRGADRARDVAANPAPQARPAGDHSQHSAHRARSRRRRGQPTPRRRRIDTGNFVGGRPVTHTAATDPAPVPANRSARPRPRLAGVWPTHPHPTTLVSTMITNPHQARHTPMGSTPPGGEHRQARRHRRPTHSHPVPRPSMH